MRCPAVAPAVYSVQHFGDSDVAPIAGAVAETGVLQLSGGSVFAVALLPDGSVTAQGQPGPWLEVPQALREPGSAVAVAAGFDFALAVTADGGVVAWGNQTFLGEVPQEQLSSAVNNVATAVAAGDRHALVLRGYDGTIVPFGKNFYGQLDLPDAARQTGVTVIASGASHSIVLLSDGTLVTWGQYSEGVNATIPGDVAVGSDPVIALAAGYDFSMVLRADGTLKVFGESNKGVLIVPSNAQSNVKAIAAGRHHALALLETGQIVAWGENEFGQIDLTTDSATALDAVATSQYASFRLQRMSNSQYTALSWGAGQSVRAPQRGVAALSVGWEHVLLLMADGSVQAQGLNSKGQTQVPTDLIGRKAVSVAAGAEHSLVLLVDGTVVAFGSNDFKETDPLPADVLPGGIGAIGIAAGRGFSLFLLRNGRVVGRGATGAGEINVPVEATNSVTAIVTMDQMSAAVRRDGTLVLWGQNFTGDPIGPVPEYVQTAGVASVSVGVDHAAAVLRNGQVALFGSNQNGQATLPAVVDPAAVSSVAAGGAFTVLYTRKGAVQVVGWDGNDVKNMPPNITNSEAPVHNVAAGKYSAWALLQAPPEPTVPGGRASKQAHESACLPRMTSRWLNSGLFDCRIAGQRFHTACQPALR
jgi:alpha-tubulin suppressor-like RCC1 family protein